MFSHLRINYRIPDTVTKVGEFAFAISTITKVTIPSSVQTIGESAFFHCWYTKEVIVEDGDQTLQIGMLNSYGQVSTMPMEADPFSEGAVEKIYLGRNVEYLDDFSADDEDEGIFSVMSTDVRTSVTIGPMLPDLRHIRSWTVL